MRGSLIKRIGVSTTLLLFAFCAISFRMAYREIQQQKLNHALIAAIKQNDTQAALTLLAQGADPNSRDEPAPQLSLWRLLLDRLQGKHPASSDAETCLQIALEIHAADSNYPDSASPPDDPAVIKSLLDRGANPNTADPSGETPLMKAVTFDDEEVIEVLIKHGADVNDFAHVTPNIQINPLITAVDTLEPAKVKLLLAHGANPNIRDSAGNSPLSLAKESISLNVNAVKIIKMLKQAGAKE